MKIIALGRDIFALAIAAFGFQNLVFARFGQAIMPIIPWVPGKPALAYLTGLIFLATGLCIALNIRARMMAILLGIFFLLCVLVLHVPRVIAKPLDISLRTTLCETLAFGGTALILAGNLRPHGSSSRQSTGGVDNFLKSGRYLFAASSLVFGIDHFLVLGFIATLVPAWIPGGLFWANFTGAAFIVAGICIATKWISRLAATWLGIMFLLWFLLLHLPRIMTPSRSHNPNEWSSAFIALGMCGASWIIAQCSLPRRHA